MTGYESKKAAALDEDGMYLVHHTKRKDDDDDTQVYDDALTIAYQSGYYDGKKAAANFLTTGEKHMTKETISVAQAYAMAQVCLDLHEALGCKWGDNPYLTISQLKAQPAQEPVNLLEARRIAAEYGTPDSQIDSGNLYFALMKCLEHIDAQPAKEKNT